MREETVSINGVLYNSKTGQPVKKTAQTKAAARPELKKVAVRQQRKITVNTVQRSSASAKNNVGQTAKRKPAPSRTLNRQIVKKPATSNKKSIASSKSISASAKHQSKAQATSKRPEMRNSRPAAPTQIMSRGVKRPKSAPMPQVAPKLTTETAKQKNKKKRDLVSIIVSGCVLIAIAAVVLIYFFVPSFSVWVAGGRANVDATLPMYTPTGYKVSGTAESSLGLVTINYHSDATNNSYTLTQANSNWDSAGVLENKVKPLGGNHQTLSQKGLTIYRYPTGAVWVNGGILYTITDEGKLSNEQILQIVDGI